MIANDRELAITEKLLEQIKASLTMHKRTPCPQEIAPAIWHAAQAALEGEIDVLSAQIKAYKTMPGVAEIEIENRKLQKRCAELEAELTACTSQCVATLRREAELKAENEQLVARDKVWADRWKSLWKDLGFYQQFRTCKTAVRVCIKLIEKALPLHEEGEG